MRKLGFVATIHLEETIFSCFLTFDSPPFYFLYRLIFFSAWQGNGKEDVYGKTCGLRENGQFFLRASFSFPLRGVGGEQAVEGRVF